MPQLFNIYCDETCHLENDRCDVMVIGGIWCLAERVHEISQHLREIKSGHGLSPHMEIKWNKVSPARIDFYRDVVDYFFDNDDLHFRGVLIGCKSSLDHEAFQQDHDTWYYKMFFTLLEPIIDPEASYQIYLDIKDTRSEEKRARLEKILRSSRRDNAGRIIRKVQQIRSHESEIMPLADLLIGAVGYHNRRLEGSQAKLAIVKRIRERSGKSLDATTWLRESKFNLLNWQPRKTGNE